MDFIHFVLQTLEIKALFSAITSTDEVKHGKPAPDIYLLTAKKLGIDPAECIAIEDATAGVHAAKKAGMKCIGYRGDPKSTQNLSKADLIIEDFRHIDLKTLLIPHS